MMKNRILYQIINEIVNMDISFILDDIIGSFVEPNIPVNIDLNNFAIDIETPYGVMHVSLVSDNNGFHRELVLKRIISDTFCEEYKIFLGRFNENFLCLEGKTIDLRSKGFVINLIERQYSSSNLTNDNEKNKKEYESGNIVVDSIYSVSKVQEVFSNKELQKVYGKNAVNDPFKKEIFETLGSIKADIGLKKVYPIYVSSLYMSMPIELIINSMHDTHINVKINGSDNAYLYHLRGCNKTNLVGRAFNIYQGIVNSENYDDAIGLINDFNFFKAFAHEDCEYCQSPSINQVVESLIGVSTVNSRREYSAEVREIVTLYYNYVKNNHFLFKKYEGSTNTEKSQLEKNAYIKQILLSNRD